MGHEEWTATLSRVLGPIWDALERAAVAQERIATALERFEPDTTEPTSDPACRHPEFDRLLLGTAGWQCGICGHRELTPLKVD